jgi:hypothetical protein
VAETDLPLFFADATTGGAGGADFFAAGSAVGAGKVVIGAPPT